MTDKLTETIIGAAIEVHKILGLKRALLINFGEKKLIDWIRRISN